MLIYEFINKKLSRIVCHSEIAIHATRESLTKKKRMGFLYMNGEKSQHINFLYKIIYAGFGKNLYLCNLINTFVGEKEKYINKAFAWIACTRKSPIVETQHSNNVKVHVKGMDFLIVAWVFGDASRA